MVPKITVCSKCGLKPLLVKKTILGYSDGYAGVMVGFRCPGCGKTSELRVGVINAIVEWNTFNKKG